MKRIHLKEKAMARLRRGHPWIFRSDLDEVEVSQSGPVEVLSPRGKVLGEGLYSQESKIALRIMTRSPEKITSGLLRERLEKARNWRKTLISEETAFRWVFGESDGLPSLIVDQFGAVIVFQTMSAGMETFKEDLVQHLKDIAHPKMIFERNDVNVRLKEGLPKINQVVWGEGATELELKILGKMFYLRPLDGQKTGFFLDQRFNAREVAPYLRGRVLDAFSYSGQFAIHAGPFAKEVLCVDQSEDALQQVQKNARLNRCFNIQTHQANVFDFLKTQDIQRKSWDAICLDPPAFVKSRSEKDGAVRGYKEINLRAMKLLKPGGMLISSSCSQNLSREEFCRLLSSAARDAHRSLQILAELRQPFDHPILLAMPESSYLKGFVMRVS